MPSKNSCRTGLTPVPRGAVDARKHASSSPYLGFASPVPDPRDGWDVKFGAAGCSGSGGARRFAGRGSLPVPSGDMVALQPGRRAQDQVCTSFRSHASLCLRAMLSTAMGPPRWQRLPPVAQRPERAATQLKSGRNSSCAVGIIRRLPEFPGLGPDLRTLPLVLPLTRF
jgi:hypothetical protein